MTPFGFAVGVGVDVDLYCTLHDACFWQNRLALRLQCVSRRRCCCWFCRSVLRVGCSSNAFGFDFIGAIAPASCFSTAGVLHILLLSIDWVLWRVIYVSVPCVTVSQRKVIWTTTIRRMNRNHTSVCGGISTVCASLRCDRRDAAWCVPTVTQEISGNLCA